MHSRCESCPPSFKLKRSRAHAPAPRSDCAGVNHAHCTHAFPTPRTKENLWGSGSGPFGAQCIRERWRQTRDACARPRAFRYILAQCAGGRCVGGQWSRSVSRVLMAIAFSPSLDEGDDVQHGRPSHRLAHLTGVTLEACAPESERFDMSLGRVPSGIAGWCGCERRGPVW